MIKKIIKTTLVCMAVALVFTGVTALSEFEDIDRIIESLDEIKEPEKMTLTLDKCISIALENNPDLKIKQYVLNSIEGDVMVDRSRFFSHVDLLASFGRNQGSLLKSYYPSLNPTAVAPLGSLDASSYTSSISTSGGGTDIDSLAAQYGISDVSSLLNSVSPEIASLATQYLGSMRTQGGVLDSDSSESRSTERTALAEELDESDPTPVFPGSPYTVGQFNALINSINSLSDFYGDLSGSSSQRTSVNNEIAIRYSRRLLEWGCDNTAEVQIRKNRRTAIRNYELVLRDLISNVRTSFFQIILKKEQIETRQGLLKEYEKKLWKQQKRYDIAKDVPKIDVLSAELDVLEQRYKINNLKADLVEQKLEMLQLLNLPLNSEITFEGELQSFSYTLEEVVKNAKANSFEVVYLKEELKESERDFSELAWDYKPSYSAQMGVENHRGAAGVTLNKSSRTYGLDMGAIGYTNLPTSTSSFSLSSSTRTENNYTVELGVNWVLYDNMKRKGIEKKQVEALNQLKVELEQEVDQEEFEARRAYQSLLEAVERLKIQKETFEVSKRRLEITRKLREYGKSEDYQVEQKRNDFYSQQDKYFSEQENVVVAQEKLRNLMGIFD
ncbi:MAG TPA: TolC family protein [bacterium]|nr:TolC family protein [bacterium]